MLGMHKDLSVRLNLRSCQLNIILTSRESEIELYKPSSSFHGSGESPVPASSIVVSLPIVFLVYLYLVFGIVDIYMPVEECAVL
jgi:hypothetical protein